MNIPERLEGIKLLWTSCIKREESLTQSILIGITLADIK